MRAILATLAAPMRSWGGASLGDDRDTLTHPTASGMLGFLGACAGVDRDNKALMARWYGGWDVITFSERAPAMMVDYHSACASRMAEGKHNVNAVITQRAYLLSSIECVAFVLRADAESDLFDAALLGLATPVFTPYVGRKSNPLMAPPCAEVIECATASDVAERLRTRWNEATGNQLFLMIAPAGMLERPIEHCVTLLKSVSDERSGALGAHASVMREFYLNIISDNMESAYSANQSKVTG